MRKRKTPTQPLTGLFVGGTSQPMSGLFDVMTQPSTEGLFAMGGEGGGAGSHTQRTWELIRGVVELQNFSTSVINYVY